MTHIKKIAYGILLFNLVFLSQHSKTQTKEELQKQKQKTEQEIAYANKLLEQTKRKEKSGYNQLLIVNKKIEIQEELIATISSELKLLNTEIKDLQDTIIKLQENLKSLKNEYALLLKQSFKRRNQFDNLVFIFSAEDFDQAYKRLKYIQQYDQYTEKKAEEIEQKQESVTEKLEELSLLKAEKHALLLDSENEKAILDQDKSEKAQLVGNLKRKQRQLANEIEIKKRKAKELENEIQRIIAEEIRKAEELARKNNLDDLLLTLTPEEKLISDNFEENRNRLPWPTERGIITGNFGIQNHPLLKGVTIENNGIDISTTEGSYARSIFKGKVAAISYIEGINNIVLIKHGNYYSVYTNLTDLLVKVNDEVNSKQLIGKIAKDTDDENKTYLNFQIWKGKEKLDPNKWIAH